MKFAQTARAAVDGIETAAAAGNWNEAKAQNTTLGQQCAGCHGVVSRAARRGSFR